MQQSLITSQTPLFLRFYARCFLYPYDEMGYELQHLFRQLEQGEINENEVPHLEQVLNIINSYQGEEIKILRENYVSLFAQWEGHKPDCPLLASDFMQGFGKTYDSSPFIEDLLDSGIPVNPEEEMDSIVNHLEYLSVLCEGDLSPAPWLSHTLRIFAYASRTPATGKSPSFSPLKNIIGLGQAIAATSG